MPWGRGGGFITTDGEDKLSDLPIDKVTGVAGTLNVTGQMEAGEEARCVAWGFQSDA